LPADVVIRARYDCGHSQRPVFPIRFGMLDTDARAD